MAKCNNIMHQLCMLLLTVRVNVKDNNETLLKFRVLFDNSSQSNVTQQCISAFGLIATNHITKATFTR